MKSAWHHRFMIVAAIFSATAFQGMGCTALTGEQFLAAVNNGAQNFLNSLWMQWSSQRIDGLFDVD